MMSRCLNPGDVNIDPLVKVVSARFLDYKVTTFPFVIIKYLMGRYFETMQIAYLSHNFFFKTALTKVQLNCKYLNFAACYVLIYV